MLPPYRRQIVSLDDVLTACENDDAIGFCLTCGTQADGIEPDTLDSECEACGAFRVCGTDELLIRLVA